MSDAMQVGVAHSINLIGLDGTEVLIEAALLPGLPSFTIVGLADTAVNEARERLRAGFQNIGITWPSKRLTINLSPADKAKSGSGFDLGIAAAILGALGAKQLSPHIAVFGEIGLDGEVRHVNGILPSLLAAQKLGFQKAIVPAANYHEAALIAGITIEAVGHLGQFAQMLGITDAAAPEMQIPNRRETETSPDLGDLADVCGQDEAVWALIIAAIGGHHVQMVGPPGVGKSMLASRFVDILPPLNVHEAVEVAAIQSVCGEPVAGLPKRRPLVSPHHTASSAALIGGGNGIPQPGAITRAHHGVLYCDEFPEFAKSVIQSLRQPLEQGWIELHRVRAKVLYPAKFQLIAAANPCRCGYLFDSPGKCTCSARDRMNYRSALAGPISDRIDLQLTLRRPKKVDYAVGGSINTAQAREKVLLAASGR
ncbi:YifB family Mg chelatase-like AAA ATPase [Arcanobacterium hippocoleae]